MTPERLAAFNRIFDNRQTDLTVINDGIHKQQNLSAVLRTCDAFGIATIHRVFDERTARNFRGTASGSQKWVDVNVYESTKEAIEPLKAQGFQIVVSHLSADSIHFREIDYTKPTAIVLGNEKTGPSAEAIAAADACIEIPMYGAVESFNVSVAAGIILSEVERQRSAKQMYGNRTIEQATVDRLMFELSQPALARYCRERGLDYPPLNAQGELENPHEWVEHLRREKKAK